VNQIEKVNEMIENDDIESKEYQLILDDYDESSN